MKLRTLYTQASRKVSLAMIGAFVLLSNSALAQSTGTEIFTKLNDKIEEGTDQITNLAYAISFLFFIVGVIFAFKSRGADSWGMAGKAMAICFVISIAVPIWTWLQA